MDSIMGPEIAASLERAIGLRLNALDLAVGPSIEQLALTILDRAGAGRRITSKDPPSITAVFEEIGEPHVAGS